MVVEKYIENTGFKYINEASTFLKFIRKTNKVEFNY